MHISFKIHAYPKKGCNIILLYIRLDEKSMIIFNYSASIKHYRSNFISIKLFIEYNLHGTY